MLLDRNTSAYPSIWPVFQRYFCLSPYVPLIDATYFCLPLQFGWIGRNVSAYLPDSPLISTTYFCLILQLGWIDRNFSRYPPRRLNRRKYVQNIALRREDRQTYHAIFHHANRQGFLPEHDIFVKLNCHLLRKMPNGKKVRWREARPEYPV